MSSEEKILIKIANIMEEFSNSYEPYLWELGYNLADNLILKIGLYILEKIENKKIRQTYFKEIYERLRDHYPNIPNYNQIQSLHSDRNIFAHNSDAIRLQIRRERAIEYSNVVKDIMLNTRLILDKQEIHCSNYLHTEENYMKGSEIENLQWNKLISICKKLDYIWRNNIYEKNWNQEETLSDLVKTMFFTRTITKYSTKLENYQNYAIMNLNRSFYNIVDDLDYLTYYIKELLDNDGPRVIKLFHQRITSSDHKDIFEGLNMIGHLIINNKNEFDYRTFISALYAVGSGINSFIRRYIEFINPKSFIEGTKDGDWISPLDDKMYKLFKEKKGWNSND